MSDPEFEIEHSDKGIVMCITLTGTTHLGIRKCQNGQLSFSSVSIKEKRLWKTGEYTKDLQKASEDERKLSFVVLFFFSPHDFWKQAGFAANWEWRGCGQEGYTDRANKALAEATRKVFIKNKKRKKTPTVWKAGELRTVVFICLKQSHEAMFREPQAWGHTQGVSGSPKPILGDLWACSKGFACQHTVVMDPERLRGTFDQRL